MNTFSFSGQSQAVQMCSLSSNGVVSSAPDFTARILPINTEAELVNKLFQSPGLFSGHLTQTSAREAATAGATGAQPNMSATSDNLLFASTNGTG